MLGYLILGMTYAFAAAVQPGPFQTYLISQTLSNGWKNTIPAAFAPLLSDVPIVLIVLLLISRMPARLVQSLQCAGGVFLLYLAIGAFKNWRDFYGKNAAPKWTGSQNSNLKAAPRKPLEPQSLAGLEPDYGSSSTKGLAGSPR